MCGQPFTPSKLPAMSRTTRCLCSSCVCSLCVWLGMLLSVCISTACKQLRISTACTQLLGVYGSALIACSVCAYSFWLGICICIHCMLCVRIQLLARHSLHALCAYADLSDSTYNACSVCTVGQAPQWMALNGAFGHLQSSDAHPQCLGTRIRCYPRSFM